MKLLSNHRKFPLSVHLAFAFLLFSAVLIIIVWLFQTVFLDSFYKSVKTVQVKRCAVSIAEHAQTETMFDIIEDIQEQNNMIVSIYDTTGGCFTNVHTPVSGESMGAALSLKNVYDLYKQAKENKGAATIITQRGLDEKYDRIQSKPFGNFYKDIPMTNVPLFEREKMDLLSFALITQKGEHEYFIIVESEITPVTSVVETLRFQLIIITIVVLLISIVIAIVTAHYVSKPISETNKKAKQLASRNYSVKFTYGNYRELCELNETLTYAASELAKADNLRKELIANISHDLRTPLTMITGYSEVMRDFPDENTPENIQIIIDEVNRLNMLVTDLLDISKLESGAVQMCKARFCLTDCIRDIFNRYTKLCEQDGYNIVFESDREVYVEADELRITQVLYNLINNAINYIGEDKTVIVKQSVIQNKVRVDVIDHGLGIESDKLEYIWERYYKVDREHKKTVVGSGLGLSIVKNILDLHKANYGVNSTVGKGCDFYFELDIDE